MVDANILFRQQPSASIGQASSDALTRAKQFEGFQQAPQRQRLLDMQEQSSRQKLDQETARFQLTDAARDAMTIKPFIESGDIERANQMLDDRISKIRGRNGDPSDTIALRETLNAGDIDGALREVNAPISAATQFGFIGSNTGATASMREFAQDREILKDAIDDKGKLKPEKDLTAEQKAVAIKLDLLPGAGQKTGKERIASDEELTEDVAKSEAVIEQRKEFAKKTGASRAKSIDSGFDKINKIDANIRNIDRAIAAIDEGASTGAIESRFFPTLRKATIDLEQVQKELGLDVVGSVTFGALSKPELDLALQTGLPTKLEPSDLKDYLIKRKAAQDKLRNYFSEQIDFLDQGGSIAGFLRQKGRGGANQRIRFDAQGNIIQ